MKTGFQLVTALIIGGVVYSWLTTSGKERVFGDKSKWLSSPAAIAGVVNLPVTPLDLSTPNAAKRKQSSVVQQKKSEMNETIISPSESECVWLGKRIISLLKREDIDTAQTFDKFYTAFNCPTAYLGKAFGCSVASELAKEEAVDEQINRCWADPYTAMHSTQSPNVAESPLEIKAN